MLNKSFCVRCYKKNGFTPDEFDVLVVNVFGSDFPAREMFFDDYWKQFKCPCYLSSIGISIFDAPPENCPYILEHLLVKPSLFRRFITRCSFLFHRRKFFIVFFFSLLMAFANLCTMLR